MGRVFSFDDIVQNRVPKLENFPLVADMVRNGLLSCPDVIGAVLCGSVLRGDFTVRSDIDVLCVYPTESAMKTFIVLQELAAIAHRLHVPVNAIPVSNHAARITAHTIGGAMLQHLRWAAQNGGIIKANPLECFRELPIKKSVRSYLLYYLRFFSSRLARLHTLSPDAYYALLEKTLGGPRSVTRQICSLLNVPQNNRDSWSAYMQTYRERVGEHAGMWCERLTELNSAYSAELHEQLHAPCEKSYQSLLKRIEVAALDVLQFVEWNFVWLCRETNSARS